MHQTSQKKMMKRKQMSNNFKNKEIIRLKNSKQMKVKW